MKEFPHIIKGGSFRDSRGELVYNNDFDASKIKRMYSITNSKENPVRGWQGHQIQKRWFTTSVGRAKIDVIKVNNWKVPNPSAYIESFLIFAKSGDILFVPEGYITRISSITEDATILVFSDYLMGEIDDEYKYDLNYFNN
ncbi:WxcM-like domain-containing protein [Dokdonia sp. Hel_I_53]|uniref:WxcM-like domain-containing protein n=1 Tax=Dokdonia sp. Hel_I_53 TaxID=1566287 RepID=UPI00119BDE84|nr:WxcM-like domain-containing protein [Dokdonia sp. Hel_I_53]TVZ51344.1 WxcM-like protein [Dokdonia sp. Hel_I_53]